MRAMKEVLRLKHAMGLSQQAISESTGIPRSTIRDYLRRAAAAGLSHPIPEDMEIEQFHAILFPAWEPNSLPQCPTPDWEAVHKELKRKGVTLESKVPR